MKTTWTILKESFNEFSEDRVLRLAAATAYYAVFSVGPLLVLIVGVAGLAFGEENVRNEVNRQVQSLVGGKSATIIGSMMSAQTKGGSLMATIIGGVALVMGASGVFGQLQDSLNTIWGVTAKPGQSLWVLIRSRFFSLATVLGIGFLLVVSMALSAFVNAFAHYIGAMISVPAWVVPVINGVASFALISLLFALLFKVLPDVKLSWRYVWIGAIGTSLLFTVGKFLLGFYLSREASASAYGAGSAFIVILLYIYYSSVIVYFGAEFTRAYARHFGSGIEPSRYAIQITDKERAEQGMPRQKQVEQLARGAQGTQTPVPRMGRHFSSPAASVTAVHAKPAREPARPPQGSLSPGQRVRAQVQAQSWTLISLGLSVGVAAGMLWKAKGLRHTIKTLRLVKESV